jgi:gamma-glutamylcyclotransferase (GGCT)/AIG2-like uncharacterized protein YtfP
MYFAYGHNTNTEEFKLRISRAVYVGTAKLKGYKLVLNRVAGVEKSKNHEVVGVVWSVPKEDVPALDWYEGLGKEYMKKWHSVQMHDGSNTKVFVYQQRLKPSKPPSPEYVRWLRKGYKQHNIPLQQLNDALSSTRRQRWTLQKATRRKSYSRRG